MKTAREYADELFDELCQLPILGASNEIKTKNLIKMKVIEVMEAALDYENTQKNAPLAAFQEDPDRLPPDDY